MLGMFGDARDAQGCSRMLGMLALGEPSPIGSIGCHHADSIPGGAGRTFPAADGRHAADQHFLEQQL